MAQTLRIFKPGETVRVMIPDEVIEKSLKMGDTATVMLADKFNGKSGKITRAKVFKSTYNDKDVVKGSIYEIEGIESQHGIPYSFLREWLEVTA